MEALKIGLCGLGTVGSKVFELLVDHAARTSWTRKTGRRIELTHLGARNLRGLNPGNIRHSQEVLKVAADPNVDVVIELIGGSDTARELLEKALENGKSVITANKELLGKYGTGLFSLARQHAGSISWEAAVAGGIPIVRTLADGLIANRLSRLVCILNGTSNYIVSEMCSSGDEFEQTLARAASYGYCEADPTLDISGMDAGYKIALLSALCWGLQPEEAFGALHCEGIAQLHKIDFQMAKLLGFSIRPLAIAELDEEREVLLRVHPALVPGNHLMAVVDGVQNAVLASGDLVGEVVCCGPGAGAAATASAVISDLLLLASGRSPPRPIFAGNVKARGISSIECRHYLRLSVKNTPGAISRILSVLAGERINVEKLHQDSADPVVDCVDAALVTGPVREGKMNRVMNQLGELEEVLAPVVRIRIESFPNPDRV